MLLLLVGSRSSAAPATSLVEAERQLAFVPGGRRELSLISASELAEDLANRVADNGRDAAVFWADT